MILLYKHNHTGISGDRIAYQCGLNPWIFITGYGGPWSVHWFDLVQNIASLKNYVHSGPNCISYRGSW